MILRPVAQAGGDGGITWASVNPRHVVFVEPVAGEREAPLVKVWLVGQELPLVVDVRRTSVIAEGDLGNGHPASVALAAYLSRAEGA